MPVDLQGEEPRLDAARPHAEQYRGDERAPPQGRAPVARRLARSRNPCAAARHDSADSVDGHEITDKGYVNQRATLERRRELVETLYAKTPSDEVIEIA